MWQGWDAPSPEERLSRVEVLLEDLGAALEAHMAETAVHFDGMQRLLRLEGQSLAGASAATSAEALQHLAARVGRLEVEARAREVSAAVFGRGGGFEERGEHFPMQQGGSRVRTVRRNAEVCPFLQPPGAELSSAASRPRGAGAFGTPDGAQELCQSPAPREEEPVNLDSSIWDCALLVVLHQGCSASKNPRQVWWLSRFNILLLWILLFFNIIIQFFFMVAIKSMSSTNPLAGSRESLLFNRLMMGQALSHIDAKNMMTRTERICAGLGYDAVADTVSQVTAYLSLDADLGLLALPGNVICFLAMMFWVIEMTVELRRTVDLAIVVWALPATPQTLIEESGTKHVVKGVTRWHKLLGFSTVLLPRFAIAVLLLYFGERFLAGNIEISELILNTCALEFVKKVDDLIFEAMATRSLISFTCSAQIQRTDSFAHDHGHEAMTSDSDGEGDGSSAYGPQTSSGLVARGRMEIFNVCFLIAFIALASVEGYLRLIKPFVDTAAGLYDDVCGLNTRFAYVLHPVTGTPLFAETDFTSEMVSLRCFHAARYEAIRIRAGFDPESFAPNATLAALVNGTSPLCVAPAVGGGAAATPACMEHEIDELPRALRQSAEEYTASPACRDEDVAFAVLRATCLSPRYFDASREALRFFQEVQRCEDLRAECSSTGEHAMSAPWVAKLKLVCAATCGICGRPPPPASAPAVAA